MFLWILREVRVRISFLIYGLEGLFGVSNMRKFVFLMVLCSISMCGCQKEEQQSIDPGPEPTGLDEQTLADPHITARVRIPMLAGRRSLNLSNAAAVAVYEAWRQQGFTGAE